MKTESTVIFVRVFYCNKIIETHFRQCLVICFGYSLLMVYDEISKYHNCTIIFKETYTSFQLLNQVCIASNLNSLFDLYSFDEKEEICVNSMNF